MATSDYRLGQLSATDLSPGAAMVSTIYPKRAIQSDALDGDEPRGQVLSVVLTTAERNTLKGVLDRAAARMDFRRAAKVLNPLVDLSTPQAGEP